MLIFENIFAIALNLDRFIRCLYNNFSLSSEEDFIRNFEYENNIYLDPEKQLKFEAEEKEMEL